MKKRKFIFIYLCLLLFKIINILSQKKVYIFYYSPLLTYIHVIHYIYYFMLFYIIFMLSFYFNLSLTQRNKQRNKETKTKTKK